LIDERARVSDLVISTALIPGRPAPVLLPEATVRQMRPGSVVVDLAVEQGGNCALSVRDQVVERHGVIIIGHSNLPALVAADASALYARNVLNFISLLIDPSSGQLRIDRSDDIIRASLVCTAGAATPTPEGS
jgi:NAD(P) transhydrogenase subunit alpha